MNPVQLLELHCSIRNNRCLETFVCAVGAGASSSDLTARPRK